jgi:chromosome segregation protein
VFLEEAAGVSKYKERRRETEHRLEDTRENLARVDDIRAELETQIEKLTRQAEVARQYKALQAEAEHKQHLLWWLRKRDAENEAARALRDVERAANDLEAETARLREVERRVETARVEHYAAGDAVNAAQGGLYEVNTEVSRLETELRFVAETRQRLEAQLAHLALQIDQWERQRAELTAALGMWQERRNEAAARIAAAEALHAAEESRLPEREDAHRAAHAALDEARDAAARVEQALQVEQAHQAHADRMLEQLRAREERLTAERDQLVAPEPSRLAELARGIAAAAAEVEAAGGRIRELQEDLPVLEAARAAALARLQEVEREANTREGRFATLKRIQETVEEGGEINAWLGKHDLQALPRLWQKITVEPGWETGVESVLRERLHSLQLADPERLARLLDDPPPAKVSVFTPSSAGARREPESALRPLASLVRYSDDAARPLVEDWLASCYAHDGIPSLTVRLALPAGAVLVNRDGHQFTRYGVSFHGPDSADAGILTRQREVEALTGELEGLARAVDAARQVHAAAERALAQRREQIGLLQGQEADRQGARHELELEALRTDENIARVRDRAEQIGLELAEVERDRGAEAATRAEAEARIERYQAETEAFRARLDAAREAFDAAGARLAAQRDAIQEASRGVQEALFSERECLSKINEVERSSHVLSEQLTQALNDRSSTRTELAGLRDEGLRGGLHAALANRVEREQHLATARGRLEEVGELLRGADEERLAAEQKLPPLRDRIGELRLKEQAARLGVEQFARQLADAGADEATLAQAYEANKVRPGALQTEIQRLHLAMAELGAINMAALEELSIATERKDFLDAQSTDLRQALDTLENAIRRIDRETREMLQQTFDEANRHFGALFPRLFGGGEAGLVMTGEEILDAGIEVRAQPPGKRTSTIHLLSGGEKALTAIALIFALFQLNPAPFCLLDEVDAPLDDTNTERFCNLVKHMSEQTQFLFISHNKITMEIAAQLVGVTMPEQGVSRVVAVDIEEALRLKEVAAA